MGLNIIAAIALGAGLLNGNPDDSPGKTEDPTGNIVEVAVSAGSFNTLVTAVRAAGLVDILSGEGPFTVFAPTDEAFAQIPEAQLTALLEDKEALTTVLTYHVVSGKVMAQDVVNLDSAKTLNGQTVEIQLMDGKVMIDDATVIATDVEAANGVIHVIDKVILPKM